MINTQFSRLFLIDKVSVCVIVFNRCSYRVLILHMQSLKLFFSSLSLSFSMSLPSALACTSCPSFSYSLPLARSPMPWISMSPTYQTHTCGLHICGSQQDNIRVYVRNVRVICKCFSVYSRYCSTATHICCLVS